MTVQLSAVICTFNRARLLRDALDALAAQKLPTAIPWEIVVVDNNSQDTTAQVVNTFATSTATPVRYVFEPQQGLSHARNRAIRETRGSILAFTDDDVLPAPDWLAEIAAAMERWGVHGIGGRILPRWDVPPPSWLARNRTLLDHLAIMDFETSQLIRLPMETGPLVWGANMAFRRALFDTVGGFDPRRGVSGTSLARGEETDLVQRALEHGMTVAYDAGPTVFHRIGIDRMRKAYFRKLAFDDGQARARMKSARAGRSPFGIPSWLYRAALTDSWKWLRLALLGRPEAFGQELAWWSSAGRLTGYWKAARLRR